MANINVGPKAGMPPPAPHGTMDQYDNFPKRIRAALQSSAYNYSNYAIEEVLRTLGEDSTFNWICSGDQTNIRNAARAVYGPDHPQAG